MVRIGVESGMLGLQRIRGSGALMDMSGTMNFDANLGELGVRLTELVAKNATSRVATRIETKKAAGRSDETITELQEIISELLDERSELQLIAQAFRDRVRAETIDVADLAYITENLVPLVERLISLGAKDGQQADTESDDETSGEPGDIPSEVLDLVKRLVSKEMLTLLQLVGFNYKRAIGEPLTSVVESYIRVLIRENEEPDQRLQSELQLLEAKRNVLVLEVCSDPEKYARLAGLS
ncbi:hypothetical protein [Arsenicicoccus dermatophilus]|uniref:hypothetical protein n=1 Tax=Arsenicicoccus dermatophilus TaxID=1076331 RepID=UPI0039174771